MPEAKELQSSPRKILGEILNNTQFTEALVTDNKKFQKALSGQIDQMPDETKDGLCREIFESLVQIDDSKKRKAALAVLRLLEPHEDINKIIKSYQSALILARRNLPTQEQIDDMFEALNIFLPKMEKQNLKDVESSWFSLSNKYPTALATSVDTNMQKLIKAMQKFHEPSPSMPSSQIISEITEPIGTDQNDPEQEDENDEEEHLL